MALGFVVVPGSRYWNLHNPNVFLGEFPINTQKATMGERKTGIFDTKERNKLRMLPMFSTKDQRNYDDDSITSNLDIQNSKTTMIQSEDVSDTYPTPQQHEYYLTFPQSSMSKLMQMTKGQYVASKSFEATTLDGTTSSFRVLLYPRGCQATTTRRNRSSDVVGIYLQLLQSNNTRGVVDSTFDLRLLGNQQGNNHPRKFHVQWSGGMRLVNASTNQGTQNNPIWGLLQTSFLRRSSVASDFGGPIMLTSMLPEFMGASRTEEDEELDENNNADECVEEIDQLQCYVRLTIHPPKNVHNTTSISQLRTTSTPSAKLSRNTLLSSQISDIRHFYAPSSSNLNDAIKSNEDYVRVGNVVVPVIDKWEQREIMFRLGVYPGVEYRILRIFSNDGKEIFYSEPNAVYELKPIYPLVEELERPWPVLVEESKIPKLLTTTMYNNISAGASLATAFFGLLTAYTISQLISIFVIPSKSMDPTLQVGDVLLVEKVTPRLLKRNNHPGDIVLFHPPRKLQDIVAASGGRINDRDLFIKRVLAKPGDVVNVKANGDITLNGQPPKERRDLCGAEPLKLIERYVTAGESVIQDNEIFVSGDCSSVSVDSRVWGPLSTEEVIGKPLFRIWPVERIGSISKLPLLDISEHDWRD
jgi:signal peptidase I